MTSTMIALLLHAVGQEAEIAGALDRLRQLALLFGRDRGDAARHDLAALGDEALQQLHVLVVDLGRVRPREGARFAPPEEGPPRRGPATAAAAAAMTIAVAHSSTPSVIGAGAPSRSRSRSPKLRRGPRSRSRSRSRSSPRPRFCITAEGPSSSASTRTVM